MTENVQHAPLKVGGKVVGLASADFTEEGAVIAMSVNHTEAGREIWDMLNDPTIGYSFHDEAEDHEDDGEEMSFVQDLAQVINRHSKEAASGTPDFILAAYLEACLSMFEIAVEGRADYRGETVEFKPGAHIKGFYPGVFIKDEVRLIDFGPSKDGLGFIETVDGNPHTPQE